MKSSWEWVISIQFLQAEILGQIFLSQEKNNCLSVFNKINVKEQLVS